LSTNGSGIYTLPAVYEAIPGDTITSTQHNTPLEDIASGLTDRLMRDGRAPMTGDLAMGSHKITGLATGTAATDAITKAQLDAKVPSAGTITDAMLASTSYTKYLGDSIFTPEKYGAVGDGVTDDTTAVKAARTAAGRDGLVFYKGTYLVTSQTGYVEARGYGPGQFKMGSETWPCDNISAKPGRLAANFTDGPTTVSSTDYSHFAVGAHANGITLATYFRGKNHGQADDEGIAAPQARGSAGNFTINGNYASGGSVTLGAATRVSVTSTGNDSARTFTFTGTDGTGAASSFTVAGPNATVAYSTTSQRLKTITQVSVDGACVGTISIGLFMLPSNVEVKVSTDGCRTFSTAFAVFDGLTTGTYYYYAPACGATPDGKFIAVANRYTIDVASTTLSMMRTASWDGRLWSTPEALAYSGATFSGSSFFYGEIKSTPSGKMVASWYNQTDYKTWVAVSTDDGLNWALTLVASTTASPNYTEAGLAIIDEKNWVMLTRVNGVTGKLKQFASTDAGASWAPLGDTNLATSGGWVSPQLTVVHLLGEAYILCTLMARDSTSAPPANPDSLLMMAVRASVGLTSATSWSSLAILVNGSLTGRSGYPTVVHDRLSGHSLVFYGDETATKTATIYALGFDAKRVCEKLRIGSLTFDGTHTLDGFATSASTTPTVTGTGGVQPSYTTQSMRWTRIGNRVFGSFRIDINGAISITGSVSVAGLPYAASATSFDICAMEVSGLTSSLPNVHGRVLGGGTTIGLLYDNAGLASTVTATNFSTNASIRGSFNYETADAF
jgi:hypothetical protein